MIQKIRCKWNREKVEEGPFVRRLSGFFQDPANKERRIYDPQDWEPVLEPRWERVPFEVAMTSQTPTYDIDSLGLFDRHDTLYLNPGYRLRVEDGALICEREVKE